MKLKTLQEVLGKVNNLAMLCSNLRSVSSIMNIEKARFEKHFHSENKIPMKKQLKATFLSQRARRDMQIIRGVLVCIREHPLPLEDSSSNHCLVADIFFCGDASGKTDDLNWPAALGVYIPMQLNAQAMALR